MVSLLFSALVLGLIGGIIPGPVITAIFTEIIQSGLVKSFRIIFIGMLTETVIAFISLFLLVSLHVPEDIFRMISLFGVVILIWLALQIWKIKKIDTTQRVHFGTGKIIAMIAANGVLWIFWITVAIPKAILLSQQIKFGDVLYLLLLELGWLLSTSAVAFIFSRFRKWLSLPHVVPFIFKLCALAFAYFAFDSAYQSILFFLRK